METINTSNNNPKHVHKRRAWVVVAAGVLTTLILTSLAFGTYLAYYSSLRDREIKELENSIQELKKEIGDAKNSEGRTLAPTGEQTNLRTYTDNDIKITFSYAEDLTVIPGTLNNTEVSGNIVGKARVITVTDKFGNKLTLDYSDGRIECSDGQPTLNSVARVREDAEWTGVDADDPTSNLFRYQDQYYSIAKDSDNSENVCINGLISPNTLTQITAKERNNLSSFDNLIATYRRL